MAGILGEFSVVSVSQKKRTRKVVELSDPTEITPPYRETGVAIPLSHSVSCGIAVCRCYTPTSFLENGLSHSKDRPNKGGIAEKASL